jgi:hypothetical protein
MCILALYNCLLPPAPNVGIQEAPPQFRYVQTVWYFNLVCHAIVVLDPELERSCALDV